MSTNQYQIEKNIPIPARNPREGGYREFIKQLEVGDSFVFSDPKGSQSGKAKTFRDAAKLVGIKLSMRTVGESTRVWRIA